MRTKIILTAFLGLAMAQGDAWADGMVMPETHSTGGSVEVRATQQRAVLWLRAASDAEAAPSWEIHIQPIFDRSQGNAAWVVPFPVRPEIHEGSQAFLDQLSLITSPVFIDYCEEKTCWCPGQSSGGDAGVGETQGETEGASSGVEVWEQGTVGTLDYAILSTDNGQDLANWLEAEGYVLPAGAAPLLAEYDVEGTFFFVSRLSATADPALPMTTVRFVLPGLDHGFYPLRLTGLGVGPTDRLGLTLWVLFSNYTSSEGGGSTYVNWVPGSHTYTYGPANDGAMTPASYESRLEELMAEPYGELVTTFAGTLHWNTLMDGQVCSKDDLQNDYSLISVCASAEDLGVDLPPSWAPELEEVREERLQVVRYDGSLSPEALARDLTFRSGGASEEQLMNNVYTNRLGYCDGECPTCPDPPPAESGIAGCTLSYAASVVRPAPLFFLLLFGLVIAACRRR